MREIEFRGKRTQNGEWIYGDLLRNNEQSLIHPIPTEPHEYPEDYDENVDPGTIGQFTGLLDKNGTKIFEGDIVREINTTYCRLVAFGKLGYDSNWNGLTGFGFKDNERAVRVNRAIKQGEGQMRGFIEVTLSNASKKIWFSVSKIKRFCDYRINGWSIMETSEELKALIEEAQKEGGVSIQYVPYYSLHPEAVPLPYIQPYPQTTQPEPLDFPKWKASVLTWEHNKEDS